jgi:hypothetical protein
LIIILNIQWSNPSNINIKFLKFSKYLKLAKNWIRAKIKIVWIDNGGEFVNHQFKEFCEATDILKQFIVLHSKAKWHSKTQKSNIGWKCRIYVNTCKKFYCFGGEAMTTSCLVPNKTLILAFNNVTPREIWYDIKLNVSTI